MKPQVEVVKVNVQQMIAASPNSWNGEVGSREGSFFDDEDDWDEE